MCPFSYKDNVFTPAEINAIINYGDCHGLEDAVLFDSGRDPDYSYRKSRTKFHDVDNNNKWIFDRLLKAVDEVNKETYQFDLLGFDHFQYTVYSGSEYYNYHTDVIFGERAIDKHTHMARKLSVSMILSDPSEYTGGDFDLCMADPNQPAKLEQKKGRLLFFPSFMLHRVTPVLSGTRKSIVVWALGPKFK
jgi:PKHD-type hydroxylase